MIATVGQFSLAAAVLAAAMGLFSAAAYARFRAAIWIVAAKLSVVALAAAFTAASAALMTALLRSDFRFEYVASYTERALPWGYKLAAFWAGQEGSLLLWGTMIALIGAAAAPCFHRLSGLERAMACAALAVAGGFFAMLLLFAADPFVTFAGAAPPDGRGLNPQLQDPGMIAHPPLLFMGYATFTVPFAVLISVLVSGRSDRRWLADIRRWLLVSWLFLTAGIVVGAWWAYIELGWGGYWAWDPVENASLLPWLTSTALLHSMIVQQHRGMFKRWTASLIALTFILCILGTYITRSGVIESVHAFAPSLVASFFLVFLLTCVVVSVALIAWRWRVLRPENELEGLISREGAFLLSNVLLVIMMLTTLVGTLFPLISGLFMSEPVSVNAPFYNRLVAPMGVVLVALMAVGPVLAFGRSAAGRIARALAAPSIIALLVLAAAALRGLHNIWALICVAIVVLGTSAVIIVFARSVAARRRSTGESWLLSALNLVDRDHRRYGGQLSHLGMMLVVIGIVGSSLFDQERHVTLSRGESAEIGRYTLTFEGLEEVQASNHTAVQANVVMSDGGGQEILRPQMRFYDTWSNEPNTEVAIRSTLREDLYVSVRGWSEGGDPVTLQVRINPLVIWIWIGAIVIGVGGLYCILPPLLPHSRAAHALRPAEANQEVEPALEPALSAARAALEASS